MTNEDEVKRLQRELREARATIVRLSPPQFRDLLLRRKRDPEESWDQWCDAITYEIIDASDEDSRTYVACPLCGSRGSGGGEGRGWLFPDGLARHLSGSHPRAEPCEVANAAKELRHARYGKKRDGER
jgi:hypothetical protein